MGTPHGLNLPPPRGPLRTTTTAVNMRASNMNLRGTLTLLGGGTVTVRTQAFHENLGTLVHTLSCHRTPS